MNSANIIIIGAGASGIAAASKLFQNGFKDISILEAENRIGGRIHTMDHFYNSIIELGAHWCHGEKGNIVYEYVKNMNILKSSCNRYTHMDMYESNGKLIDKDLTDKLFEIYQAIEGDIECSPDTPKISFGEYFIERYKEKVDEAFGHSREDNIVAMKMLDFFHKLILCYDSALSWMDISLPGSATYQRCEGDLLLNWGNKGYKTILDILMQKSPLGTNWKDSILYNKEVKKIDWNNETNKCQILCSDESSYIADHVIVTISLGVLKANHRQLFKPLLPSYKQNAIEGLGFGLVNKILLKFSEKWWPKDCTGFSFVWNKDDSHNLLNEYPHGPSVNGRSWLEDIFGFYVIDSEPNTLLGWLVGPMGSQVEELDDTIISKGCMLLLRKFLGNYYDIQSPEEIVCTRWHSNPHFLGTYSYRNLESDKKHVYASDIAEPICSSNGIPIVLFAGEATHSHYYSTVHGAIETGLREADKITNLYRNPRSNFRKCKIAIIGAGMAGLGAANTLIENGIDDILIIEGNNRPGGRIDTIKIDDGIIELGAQWLHSTSTPLYKLAKEYNLISDHCSDEGLGIYVRDDGFIYDNLLVKKVDFQFGKILEECEQFVNAKDYPRSVGDYLEERFMEYLENCENSEDVKEMKLELYDWNVLFQTIDNSCIDLKRLSAKDWGKYTCLGKDGQKHLNIRNGYGSLINILVNKLPKDVMLFNKRVVSVDYSSDNDQVQLKCQDDTKINAEFVIVTSSIGFLKIEECFKPPLPQQINNTIKNIGFNGMGKVFLFFDRKWWDTDGFQLVWRRCTKFQNCSAERWLQYISGFDLVLGHDNALMGWVGGDGVQIMEDLSEETVGTQCVNLLKKFLKRDNIPYPVRVIKSKWLSNPLVRGGYSYTTTDCDIYGSPSKLCDPIIIDNKPKIWFAGEAAHPSHFSTTHGAFESGQYQVRKLLQIL